VLANVFDDLGYFLTSRHQFPACKGNDTRLTLVPNTRLARSSAQSSRSTNAIRRDGAPRSFLSVTIKLKTAPLIAPPSAEHTFFSLYNSC
jgi:hypothetical protein